MIASFAKSETARLAILIGVTAIGLKLFSDSTTNAQTTGPDKKSPDSSTRLIVVGKPVQFANLQLATALAGEPQRFTFSGGEFDQAVPTRVTIDAADLVRWGRWHPIAKGHEIQLRGTVGEQSLSSNSAGVVAGNVTQIDDKFVAIEPTPDGEWSSPLRLPRELVSAIVFEAPRDTIRRRALHQRIDDVRRPQPIELRASDVKSQLKNAGVAATNLDGLLLVNGDSIEGQLIGLLKEKLTVRTAAGPTTIDQSKVAALVFRPPPNAAKSPPPTKPTPSPRTWVGFRDGSRVLARAIDADEKQVTLTLIEKTLSAEPIVMSAAPRSIAALQPLGGRVTYLSDLPVAGYRHVPFLSLAWDYQRDRNVLGDPLMVGEQRYLKGLGMHSASRITYDLDAGHTRFEFEVAIDASAGNRGSVVCRVFTDDGSGAWKNAFESPVIRGGEAPVPVSVDIGSAKRISLLVDFADRGDELDHVNWLDARIMR